MSEKDVTSIDFLEDNEHFADLLNTYYFHGRQVVSPEDVYERNRSNFISRSSTKLDKSIMVIRDIVRQVEFQMKATIIAVEEQSDIHYAMPIRVMSGDSANYHNQWKKIQREHKSANDLKEDEFLSGFSRKDRLVPVTTLVLYFGEKLWDGPRCLKDILDLEGLPDEMKAIICDYPIHILEVRRFTEYEVFQTDWKWIFGFLQRDTNKELLREYISNNQEVFENLAEDTYDMIRQFSHVKKLESIKTAYKNEKGEINMCKAIDDMIEEGKLEGKIEGKIEGIELSIQRIVKIFQNLGVSADVMVQQLVKECELTEDSARTYIEKYKIC